MEAKISLPINLLEATYRAVNQGKAKSRDEFIMPAMSRELATLKRA
jgi:metal-responsive CopG/Arc/MetJ family transcriptional regulator